MQLCRWAALISSFKSNFSTTFYNIKLYSTIYFYSKKTTWSYRSYEGKEVLEKTLIDKLLLEKILTEKIVLVKILT